MSVVVVDSGWDRSIGDPRVSPGAAFVGDADDFALVQGGDDHDRLGHGTSCADLVLQVAPEATIIPVRVFRSRLESSPAVLLRAIEWALARRPHLVHLSLGTVRPDLRRPLHALCARAAAEGIVVVAAGQDRVRSLPATLDSVIGVGAASLVDRFSLVHLPGQPLQFRARGSGQRARGLGGALVELSGASFAAPIVTGRLATLLEPFERCGPDEARRRLAAVAINAGPCPSDAATAPDQIASSNCSS